MLLAMAAFGLFVPNGLFVYWLVYEFHGWGAVFADRLALGFILDAFLAVGLLAVWFARRPIGPVRWPAFVALSFIGGLAFSLPLYVWLNQRATQRTRPSLDTQTVSEA
jgi:hypothetical protein